MAKIEKAGAPNQNTVGNVGDIYVDTITGREFELVSIIGVKTDKDTRYLYEWDLIIEEAGGGSSESDEIIKQFVEGTLVEVANEEITRIAAYKFRESSLETIDCPNVTEIGEYAFYKCESLKNLTVNPTINIGDYAFKDCISLETIDFPLLSGKIGSSGFRGCTALMKVNIPNVTKLGSNSFDTCLGLETIDFPLATLDGGYVFYSCINLKSCKLPEVTALTTKAFANCKRLTMLEFPKVKWLRESYIFQNCTSLNKLVLGEESGVAQLAVTNAFENTPIANGTGYIYVPDDLVESYKTATNWVTYADQIKGLSELE